MMIVNRVTSRHGFQCEAVVDLLASPEARADFEALVRNYGELLAIYSFMHLALKERGMRLLVGELADRAADIKRWAMAARPVSPEHIADQHAYAHLVKADRLLAKADTLLQRGALLLDASLLGLLSNAATELKRAAAKIGITTFDTSSCCGGSLFAHGEGNRGITFDLGS